MQLINMKISRSTKILLAFVTLFSCSLPSFAEDNVQVEDMVKALTPPPQVKTRGLKYLGSSDDKNPLPPPSLSLDIPFEYDSSAITPTGRAVLDKLAAAMKSPALEMSTFEVQGHTDAKGNRDYNTRLSDERAKSVINYLVNNGAIAAGQLVAVGKGSTELADKNNPFSATNRRVQIITLK